MFCGNELSGLHCRKTFALGVRGGKQRVPVWKMRRSCATVSRHFLLLSVGWLVGDCDCVVHEEM